MRIFLFLFIFFPFLETSGQTITSKIIDSKTRQPVAAATILDGTGEVVTFSNSDGVFETLRPADTTRLIIRCLGYVTCILSPVSPWRDTVIELKPLIYSLPPVFVGDYAGSLIKEAFQKAAAENGKYFYGKGLEMEFEWVNNKPADCYEFLQNEKISVEGLDAREVIAARHGIIPANAGDFTIDQLRSFSEAHNWYNKSPNLKKFLKDYDVSVVNMIQLDSSEVARIHFTMKNPPKRYREEGYFYIDTFTHNVLRYEEIGNIPYISILGIVKIYNLQIHYEQNYSPGKSFAVLANSWLSMNMIGTNHSGSERDTLRFYEKAYHTHLTLWNDSLAFKSTPFRIRNNKIYNRFKNEKWTTGLPVKLSNLENGFLQEMEKDGAFK